MPKRPMIREHNSETNEIIDREMNDDEYAFYLIKKEAAAAEITALERKEKAKSDLLTKLGITEEEAKLLLL